MKKFGITVTGLTKKEYFHACRENGRRMRILLTVSMAVICGLIIVFTGNASTSAFLGPLVIYVLVLGGYELLPRLTYKNELETVDPPVEYDFNGARWAMKKGEVSAEFEWKTTPRLHRTSLCLFLYNDETTCNLVPLRLLTEEQAKALETWFEHTRPQYKEYRKKQDKLAREQFRKDHPGLRLGRSGPAWGPRRKK